MLQRRTWAALLVTIGGAGPSLAAEDGLQEYNLPDSANLIAVHPDSGGIAYANGAKEIRFLDFHTGESSPVAFRHDSCGELHYTPDGRSLFLAGNESIIRSPAPAARPTFRLEVPFSRPPPFANPDGTIIQRPQGEHLIGPGTALPCLSPDGKWVYAHDGRSDVGAWKVATGERERTFAGNGTSVDRLTLSPDGKRLLVSTPKEVLGFDVPAGKELFRVKWRAAGSFPLFMPGSRKIFWCVALFGSEGQRPRPEDRVFRAMDAETGECEHVGPAPDALKQAHAAVLTADGKHAVIAGLRVLHVIDTTTGKEVATYRTWIAVHSLALTPDGKHLVAGTWSKTVLRLPVPTVLTAKPLSRQDLMTQPPPERPGPVKRIFAARSNLTRVRPTVRVTISPDGRWVAAWLQDKVRVWNVADGKLVNSDHHPTDLMAPLMFLSPDRLAVGYTRSVGPGQEEAGSVILSVPALKPLERFPGRWFEAVSPDGKTALCAAFDPARKPSAFKYELWDWTTGKSLNVLDIPRPAHVASASFRADGKKLVLGIDRTTFPPDVELPPEACVTGLLIDVATGKRDLSIGASADLPAVCPAIASTPDGKTIAVGVRGADPASARERFRDRVKFWDVESQRANGFVRDYSWLPVETPFGLHYLPGGQHLVAVGTLGVMIIDPKDRTLRAESTALETTIPRKGFGKAAFAPTADGVFVASVTATGSVYVWKVTTPPAKKP